MIESTDFCRANESPFFIIGSSRSGTTLLRLILCGHSRIHIPPETWFILPLVQELPLDAPLSPEEVREAVKIITSHFRWQDMGMHADELVNRALRLVQPHLSDIIGLVYHHQLANVGKKRFGDKTPLYVKIVPQLMVLYPEARFIHLIRDGRDVAISFIDAKFEGRCYDDDRFEWIDAIRRQFRYRMCSFNDRILEVRYEELVRNSEATVRGICEFLGENFEPSMLEFRERRSMVPERGHHLHKALEKPIALDAIGVWRQRLSWPECFAMEACIYKELENLGYALRFSGWAWRPWLKFAGLVLRALSPMLDRAIPYLQRRNYIGERLYF